MRFLFTALGVLIISGCASSPAPNFFNGNYYMAGDSNCVQMRQLSSTRIMCIDKNGQSTGYREAMTSEQMQMYRMQMLNEQAQMEQLNRQIQQTGQSFQNSGQQILQQSQSYTAPQVQQVPSYGSGTTTYRRVGNTIIDSNGNACQVVGQTVICK